MISVRPSPSSISSSQDSRPETSDSDRNTGHGDQSSSHSSQADQPEGAVSTRSSAVATSFPSVESVFTTSEEEVVTSKSGTRLVIQTTTHSGVLRTTTLPPVAAEPTAIAGDNSEAADRSTGEQVKGGLGAGGRVGIAIGLIALVVACIVAAHYIMRHKRHEKSVKCKHTFAVMVQTSG